MANERKKAKIREIPRAKFDEGINKIKMNVKSYLDSAEELLTTNKDHAVILTEFAIEELGKILMLKDEYEADYSDIIIVPESIFKTHRG